MNESLREEFLALLGGEDAISRMSHEDRADALEHFQAEMLEAAIFARKAGKPSV